jgi:hypothetical protein
MACKRKKQRVRGANLGSNLLAKVTNSEPFVLHVPVISFVVIVRPRSLSTATGMALVWDDAA